MNSYKNAVNDNEKVTMYCFYFTRYIGEYATSDQIRVSFSPGSDFLCIRFSPHTFDEYNDCNIEIDKDILSSSIDAFLMENIDTSKHSYKGFELQDDDIIITKVDDKIYCRCMIYAETVLTTTEYAGTKVSTLNMLYVEIPQE